MSKTYANSYWSADYKSGIERLSKSSIQSLRQLNDVKKLIINYIKHFETNSEYLNKLAIESYGLDNGFRELNLTQQKDLINIRSPINRRLVNTLNSLTESLNTSTDSGLLSPIRAKPDPLVGSPTESEPSSTQSLLTSYEKHIDNISEESYNYSNLSVSIEKSILLELEDFLNRFQPSILKRLAAFEDVLNDYNDLYTKVEKIKKDYYEALRLQEIHVDNKTDRDRRIIPDNVSTPEKEQTPKKSEPIIEIEPPLPPTLDDDFEFPVSIGFSQFDSTRLIELFNGMIEDIPTIRRKLPIPGYSNIIFSSDDLSNWLLKNRPKTESSRVQVERFGQSLLDMKLIVGTGFLNRKFRSNDMWFEWSDLARYVAGFDENEPIVEPAESSPKDVSSDSEEESNLSIPTVLIEEAITNVSNLKFGTVFSNFRSSILHTNYGQQLETLEEKYNESYLELQELRNQLEIKITNTSTYLEEFELMKIQLIYQCLTRLGELLYNFSLKSTTNLHKLASNLRISNNKTNYELEFEKVIEKFSTGIYYPSNLPLDNATGHNSNYQNLKLKFNLFNDVSLQLPLDSDTDSLLKKSLPYFVESTLTLAKAKSESREELQSDWESPLNLREFWIVKEKIISMISEYQPIESLLADESSIHSELLKEISKFLEAYTSSSIINFFKNWLMELSDSLLPFITYDSIVKLYDEDTDEVSRQKELLKIIATIPRNNVSSLLFIIDSIIDTYVKSDAQPDVPDVLKLNAMDSIGSVPFIHLILRPSPLKVSGGFKPNLAVYNKLLTDLLANTFREQLIEVITNKETTFLLKKEHELNQLKLQVKKFNPTTPKKVTNKRVSGTRFDEVGSPPPQLNVDGVALRPFRTGTTPLPSPMSSPKHPANGHSRNNSGTNLTLEPLTLETPSDSHGGSTDPIRRVQNEDTRRRKRSSSFLTVVPVVQNEDE